MNSPEILIVGWDGATFDHIDKLVAEGRLPTIRRLMERGVSAPVHSTYPPISAPAWVTFMTGERPARHGVFEFWETDLARYNPLAGERLVSSSSYAGKTIFDIVGEHGRVAALRVPVTFPAWSVNGVMVSGYPAPWGVPGSAQPEAFAARIPRPKSGKRAWITRRMSQEEMRLRMFREQLSMTSDLALNALAEDHAYRLLMVVFNQLDAVGHHFPRHADPAYPSYDRRQSPRYAGVIPEFHERLDRALAEIIAAAGDPKLIVIMSDHGSGPRATRHFMINGWLAANGLLRPRAGVSRREGLSRLANLVNENLPIRQELRRMLPHWVKSATTGAMLNVNAVEWSSTMAYRVRMLPPIEGININLRGRQPAGCVDAGEEYESLRSRIIAELLEIRDEEGSQVVVAAHRREELYSGPYLERAPDIIFELSQRYEGGVSVAGEYLRDIPLRHLAMRSGNHTMNGMFVAAGPAVRKGVRLSGIHLEDIMPTVMHVAGLAIPANAEGRVIRDALEEPMASRASALGPARRTLGEADQLDDGEQQSMREQLRALGYL